MSKIIIILSILILSACSSKNESYSILEAEKYIAINEYKSAQTICDEIIKSNELNNISATTLCRLSMAYMKLSEQSNENENIAIATKCYQTATKLYPDSASLFFSELVIDDIQYAEMLRTLSDAIDAPQEIRDSEPTDSCCLTDTIL